MSVEGAILSNSKLISTLCLYFFLKGHELIYIIRYTFIPIGTVL